MAYTKKTWATGDDVTAATLNNLETGLEAAAATADGAMQKTGAETVAGVKTFSSSPVVPTPTTSGQAATKGYVDGRVNSLDNVAPGSVFTCGWNPSTSKWTYNGADLTSTRPTARTDVRGIFIGAPGATADASYMIVGYDIRLDVS